jgi:hypothetical protein
MSVIEPRVTEYSVSALPEDEPMFFGSFALKVAYRGAGRWAVLLRSFCLGTDGEWDYESIPSERGDEWLATHRFDEQTALRLAVEHAPKVTVNRWTVDAALAEIERRAAS